MDNAEFVKKRGTVMKSSYTGFRIDNRLRPTTFQMEETGLNSAFKGIRDLAASLNLALLIELPAHL